MGSIAKTGELRFYNPMISIRYRLIIALVLSLAGLLSVSALELAPITRVSVIRALSPEEADKGLPVEVEGQILWRNPFNCTFYMQSEGLGIYVQSAQVTPDPTWYRVGAMVRVAGTSDKGFFTPTIDAKRVESLGFSPLPQARFFQAYETYTTTIDCDWVWLNGRIKSMEIYTDREGGPRAVLELRSRDLTQNIVIPLTDGVEEQLKKLMFRRVKFNAVAGTQFNMSRQIIGRVFYVNSPDDFEVIGEPTPPKDIPLRKIGELMRSGEKFLVPVRIQGLVTHLEGQRIYLRGDQACIKVTLRNDPLVNVGDYVELKGFVLPRPISPEFLARSVLLIDRRDEPEPVPMVLDDELKERWRVLPDSSLNQELVQIEAQLVDIGESFGAPTGSREQQLLCRQGPHMFTVKLPSESFGNDFKPGAFLRITGMCKLTQSSTPDWRLQVVGFRIEPRGWNDIEVLVPASWWNTTRLLWATGILGGVLMLILGWVALLRRTVGKQTGVITKQVKHESILNERQRLARELHDNLSQGLAGMDVQLNSCLMQNDMITDQRSQWVAQVERFLKDDQDDLKSLLVEQRAVVDADKEKSSHAIHVVQRMLTYCNEESRNAIFDLRGGLLEYLDFPSALRQTLQSMVDASDVELCITVTGKVHKLKLIAERNLLLVAKEATSNALRHAKPSRIDVELVYDQEALSLSIRDDGRGFSSDTTQPFGHFGLIGMRERMNKLCGQFDCESEQGQGSVIRVKIPDLKQWILEK